MIEKILYKLFRDSDAIRSIVGDRIYANHAPNHPKTPASVEAGLIGPSIVARPVGGDHFYTLTNEIGVTSDILQIDAYAASDVKAFQLAEVIRNRLSGFRGLVELLDDGDFVTSHIQTARIISKGSFDEEPTDGSDVWVHRYRRDYEVFYTADVPTHA